MRDWASLPPIPPPSVAVIDPKAGTMTKDWYRYLKAQDALLRELRSVSLGDLADVSLTSPPDGDILAVSAGVWGNITP